MPDTRDIVTADLGAGSADAESSGTADPGGRSRRLWFIGGGVLLLLLAAYVAGAIGFGDRVPRSTTVSGVDIGGLSRADAQARLDAALGPRLTEPVDVTVGETTTQIAAEDALTIDTAAVVEDAAAGSAWNPLHIVRVLIGGAGELDAEVRDDGGLRVAVLAIATDTDVPAVDATVSFADGAVTSTPPADGTSLDVDGAVDAILAGILDEAPIVLPVEPEAPVIDAVKLKDALDRFAEPAMSGPITVTAGTTEVALEPADLSPFLSMAVEGDELVPALDVDALIAAQAARFAGVIKPPVSASFTFEGGTPKLIPAVEGTTIDPATLQADVLDALASVGDERVVEASTTAQQPELSTPEAEALGIKEPISEFTTNYPIAAYRLTNIGRAAELINGTLVLPGGTFSLNGTVGERTAENGFVKGFIIDGGQFREDYGGGVSQVATTTFNAVFFAGLEDVEHKPHSFYISRYPAGREATVAWPTVDLKFRNDTNTGVLIQTIHTPGEITVRFWGTKAYDEVRSVSSDRRNLTSGTTKYEDSEECVDQDPVSGFDITVTRQFVVDGAVVRSEDFVTHYNPADRIICGSPPT